MSAFPNVTSSYAYTCDKVFWRWTSYGFGSGKERVSGITEMDVIWVLDDAGEEMVPKVDAAYGEFNAAAVVVDLGGTCSVPARGRA
jgi:hypothetical protein